MNEKTHNHICSFFCVNSSSYYATFRIPQGTATEMSSTFTKFIFKVIIPLFLLAMVLIVYYQTTKASDNRIRLSKQISYYGNIMSKAVIGDIVGHNSEALYALITSLEQPDSIHSVEILNDKKRVLAKNTISSNSDEISKYSISSYFIENGRTSKITPIYQSIHKREMDIPSLSQFINKKPIGYVVISFDYYYVTSYVYYETIVAIVFLMAFLLFISFIFNLKLKQLNALTNKIKNTPANKFELILDTSTFDVLELKQLSSAIINKLKDQKENLILEASDSTKKLKLLEKNFANLNESIVILGEKYKEHKTMVASIGHDIKSPVDVIEKTAELIIQATNLSSQDVEWINRISRASSEIDYLAKNIMDSSLLDSAQTEVEVDLLELLVKCVVNARVINENKSVKVYTRIDETSHNFIYMNKEWVNRVVNNLVSNSLKLTNEGSIFLTFNAYSDDNGDFLKVTIKDDGLGLCEDELEMLRNDSYQSDLSIHSIHGASLGLYICKLLIEGMNGEIFVDSNQSSGTEFTFIIPVSIHAKKSPAQIRSDRALSQCDVDIALFTYDPELIKSHRGILQLLMLNCCFYSSLDEIKDHDIIVCVDIPSYSQDIVSKLKSRCKRLIVFEVNSTNNMSLYKSVGIDLILHRHTSPYDFIKRIIMCQKEMSSNISRIGTASSIGTSVTSNLIQSIPYEDEKLLSGTTILLVDGHEDHLATMSELMRNDGALVDASLGYEDALIKLTNRRYDIIITDFHFNFTTKNGADISKSISNSNHNKETPIICLTADRAVTKAPQSSKYFKSILDKPTNYQKILMQILKLKTKNKGIRNSL